MTSEIYKAHDGLALAGLVVRQEVSPIELLDAAIAVLKLRMAG